MLSPPLSGLLVVDKPRGPTSHDVVGRIRRTLGTRSVGHAGTLDPMATGVLLVLVGACTKLSRFLTLEEKTYRATLRIGTATDTLDADGVVTATEKVPPALLRELASIERGDHGPRWGVPAEIPTAEIPTAEMPPESMIAQALMAERARTLQVPPKHSAIKRNGVASYQRARRGEEVDLPPREVHVLALSIVGARQEPPELDLTLRVSKGYYVRALARDMGAGLGMPCHLCGLRRVASGPWGLEGAVAMHADAESMRSALISIEQVARTSLPIRELTQQGAKRAPLGQRLSDEDFSEPPPDQPSAWFSSKGRLIAVGDRSRGYPTVRRVFLPNDKMC